MINKQKKEGDICESILIILLIINVVTIFSIIWANDSILRILYYSMYMLNYALLIMVMLNYKDNYKPSDLVVLILIFLIGILGVIYSSANIDLNITYFSKFINFTCMINAIFIGSIIKVKYKTVKMVYYLNFFISLMMVFLSFSDKAYASAWKDSLSLGFSNPNTTGIFLFLNIIILRISVNFFSKISKVFGAGIYLLIIYLTYLCYKTNSRATFFAILFVLFFSFLKKRFVINKLTVSLIVLLPIVFVFLYITLFKNNLFLDLTILGKPFFSGREVYWINIMDDMWWRNIYLGTYSRWSFTMMHNAFFDIISTFGVFILALYIIFIFKNLLPMIKINTMNKISYIAVIGISAMYIQSAAESVLVTGGYSLFIFVLLLFLLIRNNEEILAD